MQQTLITKNLPFVILFSGMLILHACTDKSNGENKVNAAELKALQPVVITDSVDFDTDDPAIWIHPAQVEKSLILGTDKEVGGGIYAFDLDGKIVHKVTGLQRPNNIDVAYGFRINGQSTDIAVFTERKAHKIRVFSLPDLKPIDGGGIEVFAGESGDEGRDAMGIALYTSPAGKIYAIAGRKQGPDSSYLWQYLLEDSGSGTVTGKVVRKFGRFSGRKEIEAIAVDNNLGYVYYSDEQAGIRKYYADPAKGNEELAFFGQADFLEDNEGISIYPTDSVNGYILVSNQQDNSFLVYPREGDGSGNVHQHALLAKIPVSTLESDGSEVTPVAVSARFPKGLFVAMSEGRVFHYYDWQEMAEVIQQQIGGTRKKVQTSVKGQ